MAFNFTFARFSSRYSRCDTKKAFDVVRVGKSRFDEAIHFMKKNYLDDPFVRSMGISRHHDETQQVLTKLWASMLKSELSLAAVKNRKICGLCINNPLTYRQNNPQSKDNDCQALAEQTHQKRTRSLLKAYDKIDREIRFPYHIGDIKTLGLSFCSVGRFNRGMGIAQRIINGSAELAMLLGYDFARLDSTNSEFANTCKKLGWNKIWEMPYDRFDGIREDIVPDDDCKIEVFIKPLQTKKATNSKD